MIPHCFRRTPFRRAVALAAALAALWLAGCTVQPTPYQPLADGRGYEETQLQPDVYRVTFHANRYTPEQRVLDYLFLRSAELTQQQGYPYFVVEERRQGDQPARGSSGPHFSFGFGVGTSTGNSFLGLGMGTSTQPSGGTGAIAAFRIRLLTAKQAKGRDNAYDAAEVIGNLRPKVAGGKEAKS